MHAFLKNSVAVAAVAALSFHSGLACGPWLPNRLLDQGGSALRDAPEFYYELELKRIAAESPTPFKAVPPDKNAGDAYEKQNEDADAADFSDAIAKGEIKPPDAEKTKAQNKAGQAEFPGEFAEYHRGADLFHDKKFDEARKVWEALLELPKEQRHYRSTWAAFMLGKIALDAKNSGESAKRFQQTRQLAGDGFSDSIGLASSSFGWEARAALDRNDLPAAARLYLQGLAGGDLTSIDSLVTVAQSALAGAEPSPDTEMDERMSDTLKNANAENLRNAAADPVLRRVVTAYLLTRVVRGGDRHEPAESTLAGNWLSLIEKSDVPRVESGDLLGWIAYSLGNYDAAARWLKRSDPATGMSLWLKAKLDYRSGKIADATAAMSEAVRKIPFVPELESRPLDGGEAAPSAPGDLAMIWLARGEFLNAFHFFMAGNHWQDAAYVAERVLTPKELQDLVDKEFPFDPAKEDTEKLEDSGYGGQMRVTGFDESLNNAFNLRYLLARRLVRLGRYKEARPYFPKPLRAVLDDYVNALTTGDDKKITRQEAAGSLWKAARLAREQGMELMGTELEPDALIWSGEFEESEVAVQRRQGIFIPVSYDDSAAKKPKPQPLVVLASPQEKKRLSQSGVTPEKRFHYRYLAADLAWRAAKLMPDNDEQTALVLNTAGSWLKDRDDKAADRFYQALEKRCPKTKTGAEAIKRHWFAPIPDATPAPVQ